MANITNLEQFLTDVATAIRTKKETTGQILAENFDQEILSIVGSSTLYEGDAIGRATIDITVGDEYAQRSSNSTINLSVKTGDFVLLRQQTRLDNIYFYRYVLWEVLEPDIDANHNFNGVCRFITADTTDGTATSADIVSGKTAYVNNRRINGSAKMVNNQDKEITANGTYTADEGYTGLGTVTVNVPQTGDVPVKLFETKEQMQADTTTKEGDLAVVYRSEIQNATVDSHFQVATFPDIVVLDSTITDFIDIRYRAVDSSKMFDCWGGLNNSEFRMDCYTESGEIRIEYRSSDGITYTRTRLQGDSGDLENPVDFGTEIYYERAEMWNDAIGKFIQVGGSTFEGLFNYLPIISDEIVTFGSVKYKLPKAIINYSETVDFNNKTNGLMFRTDSYVSNRANSIMKVNNYEEINGIRCAKSGSLYFIMAGYPLTAVITATNETRIAFTGYTGGTSTGNTTYVRKVDFDENGITNTTDYPTEQLPANFEALSVKGQTYYWDISAADDTVMKIYVNGINGNTVTIPQRGSSTATLSFVSGNEYTPPVFNTNVLKWLYAPTQLTLAKANELLPGKIAYGKNGVVEGDGSIYDNLSKEYVLSNILGIPKLSNGTYALNNKQYFISSSKELEIPPTKVQFIKQSDFVNRDKIYLISKRNCISTENDNYKLRDKYLSKSGEFYAEYTKSDTTLYDIVRTSDKLIVASITISEFLDYADGKLIYTKSALSETVSQKIYMYDIDTQTETELGDTPIIPSTYSWNYKYSYYKVYGTTLLYSVNGEYSSSRIAASVRLYDLLTGVVTDLPTINVSTTNSLGYHILPILHEDGKQISIFQRSRKNGTETKIYYMYIYNTVEHTLTTKANGITTNLMWDFTNYLYKEEPIIVGSKAFGRYSSTWYVMDILNPVAVTNIVLDNGANIFDYHHRNMDYITVSGQTVFVSDKQYDTSTKVLTLTYGDSFIFGSNCTVSIVANSGISGISSCDLANIRYDGTHYTVDMVEGAIIGKDIDIYAHNLSDNTDFNHSIVNSNNLTEHTISLLDNTDIYEKSGPISPAEYDSAIGTANEILGEEV